MEIATDVILAGLAALGEAELDTWTKSNPDRINAHLLQRLKDIYADGDALTSAPVLLTILRMIVEKSLPTKYWMVWLLAARVVLSTAMT